MRHKYLYIIALCSVLMGMVACNTSQEALPPVDEASRIYLGANVGSQVVVRAPYAPANGSNTPSASSPLDVSVWASTTDGVFPNSSLNGSNNDNGIVAIHTRAHFTGGDPQLLGEAVYPKGNALVYFVGLHPKSNDWTTDDGTQARFTISGREDVMFAPKISGKYGIDFENSPTFHFRHLLTYLRIEMVADMTEDAIPKREEVSEAWGAIKKLTIKSRNKIVVDLNSNSSYAAFEEELPIDMSLYHKDSDTPFPATNDFYIPTTITEVAYVLCEPVEAEYTHIVNGEDVLKPEYTLHLETDQRTIEIPIDLKLNSGTAESSYFTGSTIARQFTILLNFKMGDIISVAATIALDASSDWHTHGTGSKELGEEDLM